MTTMIFFFRRSGWGAMPAGARPLFFEPDLGGLPFFMRHNLAHLPRFRQSRPVICSAHPAAAPNGAHGARRIQPRRAFVFSSTPSFYTCEPHEAGAERRSHERFSKEAMDFEGLPADSCRPAEHSPRQGAHREADRETRSFRSDWNRARRRGPSPSPYFVWDISRRRCIKPA